MQYLIRLDKQVVISTSTALASASINPDVQSSWNGDVPVHYNQYYLMVVSGVPAYIGSLSASYVSGSSAVSTGPAPTLNTGSFTLFPVTVDPIPVQIPRNTLVFAQTAAGTGQVSFVRAYYSK